MSLPGTSGLRTENIRKEAITFPNDNRATAIFPSAGAKPEDIVSALNVPSFKAVILIIGGAGGFDATLAPRLTQLFSRGIARAAIDAEAVIIDGATGAGVIAMMGEGVAGRGYKYALIGIAPAGLVTYPGHPDVPGAIPLEPNHSHFVLVDGLVWGSETPTMFKVASALAAKAPGVAVLAGGGDVSRDEALRVVRGGLPLIVVEGSGGLTDEIAAAWKQRPGLPDDPLMAEIIADGDIQIHPLGNSVQGIERVIIRELEGNKQESVLRLAWETFADYDLNADLQQNRFSRIQLSILAVGVLGTALAITQQVWAPKEGNVLAQVSLAGNPVWWSIRHLLVVAPILLTVLITAANRFKQGSKWLLLRSGAESIKREIYRYRARATYYKNDPKQPSPEQQLFQKVEDITRRTMRTEVNSSALTPYDRTRGFPPPSNAAKSEDDGFSRLTADRYIKVRLGDQLDYFHETSVMLERKLEILYWLTFLIGGVGTYLAAVGQQVWIALTTAIVAAIGTYLGYRQTESSLTKYNQVATDLANVKAWWIALSAEEQASQENVDLLVEHTEQVLQSELDGWVQQMRNSLDELRQKQEPVEKKDKEQRQKEENAKAIASQSAKRPGPAVEPNSEKTRIAPDAGNQP